MPVFTREFNSISNLESKQVPTFFFPSSYRKKPHQRYSHLHRGTRAAEGFRSPNIFVASRRRDIDHFVISRSLLLSLSTLRQFQQPRLNLLHIIIIIISPRSPTQAPPLIELLLQPRNLHQTLRILNHELNSFLLFIRQLDAESLIRRRSGGVEVGYV